MRVATIDIGTNSVLLLIAEERGCEFVSILERATITRLGYGVDATRVLDPIAVSTTLDCLKGYADDIRQAGVGRVAIVGTSAMRDAGGGDEFKSRVREIFGEEPRVISGHEEAELTFAGALSGLGLGGTVLVFDLGGGSTEIILGHTGECGNEITHAISLDMGSVRFTERHVCSNPPCPEEIAAVRRAARLALNELAVEGLHAEHVVGVAGTVTTVAAFALNVVPYDAARVHGARVSASAVANARATLARLTLAERCMVPTVDPRRADVIVAGAIIVEEILAWSGACELIVSDRGVRWGLVRHLAE